MREEGGMSNMNKQGKSKTLVSVLSTFLLFFYIAIIMYVLLGICHIDTAKNFIAGIVFQIIGFVFLSVLILGNILFKSVKTGYFIPLVTVTILYSILLELLNIFAIATLSSNIFVLLQFVLLFVYCLISIPMYIMGKK